MTYQPFVTTGRARPSNTVILCDHAQNTVPPAVGNGDLGLPSADMARHIAYDIGAMGVSLLLGKMMNAPVVCSNFSRLVIDPNRGEDDPTLLMRLYDGTLIPTNRYADEAEIERRLEMCYRPYHTEIASVLAERENPVIVSVHSFTPQLRGREARPWEVAMLSGRDRRLSEHMLTLLRARADVTSGDNVPYTGHLKNDTMDKHANGVGMLHTLIELRQDLIETQTGQNKWAKVLAPMLISAIKSAQLEG